MPAYFDTGFSVRKPMWHGLGTVLEDYPVDWEDARKKAGLLWEPTYADLYVEQQFVAPFMCSACQADVNHAHLADCTRLPEGHADVDFSQCVDMLGQEVPAGVHVIRRSDDGTVLTHVPVAGHQAIIRDDTRAVLATPTDSYKLIYHSQMGELLDAYTETWRKAGAKVNFETAGVLRGGAMVWALVWLDEPFVVPGDQSETYPFAALLNAHDGSAACRLMPTSVRIVCWNTFKMAEAEASRHNQGVILRHSGNVEARVEEAKVALGTMRDEAKEWEHLATEMAGVNVSDEMFVDFLHEFIPIPEGASERTRNSRGDRQAMFTKLYMESPTTEGIRGTAYGLAQAAGEYLDHLRPFQSRDTYMSRTMLTNDTDKGKVMRRVLELVRA